MEKKPGVCGGEACIRNTRHTVAGLVQWRNLGLANARILEHHPDLTEADLEVAWSSYHQNMQEIDAAIALESESSSWIGTTQGLLPQVWATEDFTEWNPPDGRSSPGPDLVVQGSALCGHQENRSVQERPWKEDLP
jgi:uncharacterized protein (DUF433 family)